MPAVSKQLSDLDVERTFVNFNTEEFTNWYYGGAEKVAKKRFLEKYFLSDERLKLEVDTSYLSYKERYEEAMRRSVIVYENIKKLHKKMNGNDNDFFSILDNLRAITPCINIDGNPIMLHYGMFPFAFQTLANEEQRSEWIPKIVDCKVFGTYAQTELGHGTFVRGLETTATYDPKTKEFIINTPSLSAYKFWPGNLGHTANHTVVFAQLYIQGQCHGVQPFVMRIRDQETHKPLPGIKVGDIGNKLGFDTVSNGYLAFDNVRIPLKNMLMGNSKVTPDGKFIKLNNPLLNYGVMLYTRVCIILDATLHISKAATIATRYSMVRRQSPINPNDPEPKIIEHVTQQYKIFPAIAKSIMFKIVADYLAEKRVQVTEELKRGNLKSLPELHALSCCLKAVCTNEAVQTIETCRLACGGHGFMNASGFYSLYKFAVTIQHYEGDNTILLLQTARYLMKSFDKATKAEILDDGVKYLKIFIELNEKRQNFENSIFGILRAFQIAAAGKIYSAWKNIEEKKKFMTVEEATNRTGIELIKAAKFHCYVNILEITMRFIEKSIEKVSPALGLVLKNIFEFYATDMMLNNIGEILKFVNITNDDIEKLQMRIEVLLKFLRTSAIGIVDGFDFSDQSLSSTIGAYDGNVYENIFAAAKKSPLNQEDAMSKELQEERNKIKFNVEEFTNWFYGGPENVKRKNSLENYFLSDPKLNLNLDTSYLSYKEQYEEAIRRSCIVHDKMRTLLLDCFDDQDELLHVLLHFQSAIGRINPESDPLILHFTMFAFTMLNLTNDEQKAEWLPKVLNCSIIGTYAQTEMGHGTYLNRLETTATYDPKTKEFILNSPTLTSYKFWPGNLGHTANHAIVMAQLYTQGQCYGVHPFIVQLRDLETHKLLNGVKTGDIGNKVGFQTVNNGYLCLSNVRIPLKNMLMKSSKVLEDGTYVKPKSSKLNYGTMMFIRVKFVTAMATYLAKAATIATRYSMVRRQSPINPNDLEPKIIEHKTQQYKVFVPLAKAIIYRVVSSYLSNLLFDVTKESNEGNLERLPELHALACCIKAVSTYEADKDVEMCRLACGGHGYLKSAGFTGMQGYIKATVTGEGENTVMHLQTARYLMKTFTKARNGEKLTEGVAYLSEFINLNGRRLIFDDSIRGILRAIQTTAAGKIAMAWKHIEERKKNFTAEEAASYTGIELTRASELHCHTCLLQIAIVEIEKAIGKVSRALGEILRNVLELYAVDTILRLSGDVLLFVNMTAEDVEKLQKRLENSLQFFRSTAIGIVDGFDFSDQILDSTLGAYDGNVYENLFAATKKSTLNDEEVNKSFHLYLKPFMKANL
ncbi:hypothetical protein PVAND_015327 [Polypedilum vanderplanki]|uniref:Acyl-coenzyme A oxidase n=1 Tax=Polypedilum vanderplanki TaxID=319348 RepID=A0A9J6BCP6_POLVA|nr:hypothetical protein PVAND_015327 [Polypedilum vanderplanki]